MKWQLYNEKQQYTDNEIYFRGDMPRSFLE